MNQPGPVDPMDQVVGYLKGCGVEPVAIDENTVTIAIEASNAPIQGVLLQGIGQLRRDQQLFVFYVAIPDRVPRERRGAVAEFITRANYGLPMGTFEMDFSDGEVRLRSGLDYEDGGLTHFKLKNLLPPTISLMERYLPSLLAVIYSSVDPAEAIRDAERE